MLGSPTNTMRLLLFMNSIERRKNIMNEKEYLNEKEVSQKICRALSSLRNDRFNRKGIPYIKVGRSVRYSYKDVIAFMENCKVKFGSV